jgi:hypothetical protein
MDKPNPMTWPITKDSGSKENARATLESSVISASTLFTMPTFPLSAPLMKRLRYGHGTSHVTKRILQSAIKDVPKS